MDVAFIGNTAYALVTVVSDPLLGGTRIRTGSTASTARTAAASSPTSAPGRWRTSRPVAASTTSWMTGVQYAMEPWRGGFLVTDGHHNRVLRVGLDGSISRAEGRSATSSRPASPFRETRSTWPRLGRSSTAGRKIGKIVAIDAKSGAVTDVAGPAPLVVDVERGRGQTMFGLAQGTHSNRLTGTPADPNTGELLRVDGNGGFSVVANGLDRPTSLEIIGTTAYVVTLGGEIWKIDNISGPPYGG